MLRTARLGLDEFGLKLVRQPCDDLVLHAEEVGQGLVEALGPEMRSGLGLDQLHVDAHAASAALHAAFEDVAHVELAPDLFEIDGPALVGEGRAPADDERARDAREVGGQALGDAVDEILLLGIAADVGEGQDD